MKRIFTFSTLIIVLVAFWPVRRILKKLITKQKGQEKTIKTAYKQKKVTENEYTKLMEEQEVIKNFIEASDADGVWTSKELNALHAKLERAEKRLKRYRTNNEIY